MHQRGMELKKAKKYLTAVVERKETIPFRRYCGGVGRTAQVRAGRRRAAASVATSVSPRRPGRRSDLRA